MLIGGVLVAFAAWLFGTLGQVTARPGRLVASVFAVAALLGASLLLPLNPSANATTAGTMPVDSDLYEEFTPDRLEELRAEGRPVFINLTAAWCITCEVNDRVVLSRDAVVDAMEAQDIAYLKGDWTNRDADITALLESYGRNGVPLYLVYPKGAGEAQMLPQILTERLVLEAFNGVDAS
ncbi:MAG: thioredoxin family protein [Pseudomonadota bacterium]